MTLSHWINFSCVVVAFIINFQFVKVLGGIDFVVTRFYYEVIRVAFSMLQRYGLAIAKTLIWFPSLFLGKWEVCCQTLSNRSWR